MNQFLGKDLFNFLFYYMKNELFDFQVFGNYFYNSNISLFCLCRTFRAFEVNKDFILLERDILPHGVTKLAAQYLDFKNSLYHLRFRHL